MVQTKPNTGRRTLMMEILESRQMEDGQHEITIAANDNARDFIDLDLSTLRMDNCRNNPVVLWAHQRGTIPIARSTEIIREDGGRIRARFEFLPDDEFAQRVENAWSHGFIRAASVSFGGGDVTFLDNGKIRMTNAELYEWSLVPVPADPDALRMAERAIGLPDGMLATPDPSVEPLRDAGEIALIEGSVVALTQRIERLEATSQQGKEPVGDDEDPLAKASREYKALLAFMEEHQNV